MLIMFIGTSVWLSRVCDGIITMDGNNDIKFTNLPDEQINLTFAFYMWYEYFHFQSSFLWRYIKNFLVKKFSCIMIILEGAKQSKFAHILGKPLQCVNRSFLIISYTFFFLFGTFWPPVTPEVNGFRLSIFHTTMCNCLFLNKTSDKGATLLNLRKSEALKMYLP